MKNFDLAPLGQDKPSITSRIGKLLRDSLVAQIPLSNELRIPGWPIVNELPVTHMPEATATAPDVQADVQPTFSSPTMLDLY